MWLYKVNYSDMAEMLTMTKTTLMQLLSKGDFEINKNQARNLLQAFGKEDFIEMMVNPRAVMRIASI